ncbi:PKD domain-containing protein [Flavobacterium sp. LB1P71]|uniref:PKD domain-containing protein n=1 Tax=unclassified Flavobacterium TaxID=196869 RepID=UPI003AAB81F3
MKHLYKIIFLFVLIISVNNLNAKSNYPHLGIDKRIVPASADIFVSPTATISGTTAVCQYATQPQITFTGAGGTGPYVFTYNINGGASLTATTTSGDSVTVSAPTITAGTFIYNLVSVHDASLPLTEITETGTAVITINPQPDASLSGTGSGTTFNGIPAFRICSNVTSPFTFSNTSSTSSTLNTNYTIDWGDGSPNFTSASWTTTTHTYAVGYWNLTYTIQSTNSCEIIKKYVVFVGSNPAVSLGNPGNTDICNSTQLTFPISGTENNPSGTTYTISFNDGSSPITYNHPPPATISHTFLKTSCGITSSDGTNSYPNSFRANIVAQNPCGTSAVGVVPIYVSTPPTANFTIPTNGCTNTSICLNNTTTGGFENNGNSNSCNTNPKFVWTISPSTGYTVVSGSIGNDFGSIDPNLWLSGSSPLCLNFSQGGTYTISIKTANRCGSVMIKTQQICIEAPLTPLFTLNNISGCAPLAITTTNTTIETNSCTPPTYLWTVTYAAANCGTTIAIPNQTTKNASYNFTIPGIYTIRLTATNSCGSVNTSQTVEVKKPPTITAINGILANYCGPTTINPTATVSSCAPASSTLTYAWSFPGGSPATSALAVPGAINYATAGNYTVSLIVSNECGASATTIKPFTINDAPVLTNTPLNQTICSGSSTALVNLTSSPAGATFSWTATATAGISGFTPSGTSTIPIQTISTTNASPGTVTYAITPSLGGCPGTVTNYVITINPAPAITAQPASSTVCLGGSPAVLSFTTSGVIGTPTYQWYSNTANNTTSGTAISGETNATYTPPSTTAGTFYYYCIITLPSGGCSNIKTNTATVTILPNATITTQPTPTQNLCVGVTSTPLTIAYSGGTGTVNYQWFSNASNSIIGGSPIAGATSATYSPPVFTSSGNYYYYATVSLSGNGCLPATSNVAEVIVYADPTISAQPIATQTLCQTATPLNLDVTATGGNGTFNYQWYSNSTNANTGGTLIVGATSNSHTPLTNTVGTKYYYCVVSQNSSSGCNVSSATAAIIVISSPTITQPASSTVCQGGTPTALSITVSGATGTPTYQWYSNTNTTSSGGTLIPSETSATFNPPATVTGTFYYYCIITLPSGGCSSITSNTATVTINAGAIINTQPTPTQSLCVGATIQTPLSITYSGGTGTPTYQWFSNSTNSNSGGTLIPGATNASYTPPVFNTAGNFYYYCQVSFSGNGCGSVFSNASEISVVTDPIISTQPLVSQTLCQNGVPSDLTVSVTGGIGTYSYQWYSNTSNLNSGGVLIINATNAIFIPPTASVGTLYYYCVISQSGIGCGVVSAASAVIVNSAPTFTKQPKPSIICLGNIPNLLEVDFVNGAGIPQYQWFSNTVNTISGGNVIIGATTTSYNPPATNVGTLYYYCVVTLSSGGCSSITSNIAEVKINQNPVIASKNAVICSGTAFTITPDNSSGDIVPVGTTYTWTTPVINPSNAVNGAFSVTIPQNNISQTLINTTTSPATVTYTVTPTSGTCVGTNFTIVVTVNPSINPNSILTNSTCFGINNGSIQTNLTGGIPFTVGAPYVVSWTGPNGFTSSATNISNLSPGDYTLSVLDNGGCPFSKNYKITEPDAIVITTDLEKDITCFGNANGAIAITITGGTVNYKYAWTKDNLPFANTEDLSNLSPGVYAVSVSDSNNCGPVTTTFTITEPPVLVLNLVSQTNVLCFGTATGAIAINVVGGTPIQISSGVFDYNYAWTGPNGFTSSNKNLNAIFAGTYDLTVTDNSGCTKKLSVLLTQSSEIIIKATTTVINCYGDNNASISLVVSGGNAPYKITWSTLATGLFQGNLSAGDYLITVTDALNCINTLNVNIPEAPIFTINPAVKQISCFGMNDGSINLNLVGGIAPLKLVWSDGSTAGLTRNNLGPGSYTVTIIDSKPCIITRTFILLEPQKLVLSANVTHAFDCDDTNSGVINLLVAGGTPPFTYTWSNGATAEDLTTIPAGNYLVTVTDSRGCSKMAQYVINRQPPIVIGVETKTDFNCDAKSVKQTFVAQVSGGVPPYQLTWSSGTISGVNSEMMNTNQNGTVILGVTDSLGCTANYIFNVAIPKLGTPSFTTSSYSYATFGTFSISDPIQFMNTATEDYSSTAWDFGDGSVSSEENPTHTFVKEGSYVVTQTVTYPFGCIYTHIVTLLIDKGYKMVIPNGFTPNGDGINETFKPVFVGLKLLQLDVYDTWGELIYSEKGETLQGWDGKIKERESENGNYYYKVKGTTFYGKIMNENGPFTLIK